MHTLSTQKNTTKKSEIWFDYTLSANYTVIMAKDFEEKVLKALGNLQADVSGLKKGQASLENGQESLQKGQASLEKGQKKLQSDVTSLQDNVADIREDVTVIKDDLRKVEVRQEDMESTIDRILELSKVQAESWKKSATKEDIYGVEVNARLHSSVAKSHSVELADHERRLKRLEAKTNHA